MKKKILFAIVGQNPKSEINIEFPFKDTASLITLTKWLTAANVKLEEVALFNAVDKVGRVSKKMLQDPNNLKILKDKLRDFDYVVSLGEFALIAITKANVNPFRHYNIPHPSGLNRKLNSKDAHELAINTLSLVKELSRRGYRMRELEDWASNYQE